MQSTLLSGTSIIINGVIMLTSIAYFDPYYNYKKKLKRSITDNNSGYSIYVYAEKRVYERNGYAHYIYVYSTDDIGTSKTYDRTEYFKIKDQIRENMKTIQLIGYHDNNWCWIIYR
jgi:N-acetylneuraminic acid mutarotase